MTKKGFAFISILIVAVIVSCAHRPHKTQSSSHLVEVGDELMMIGPVSYEDILNYFPAWKNVHQQAEPAEVVIDRIKGIDVPLDIQCFVGTWCSDSRYEVPPFMKSLSLAGNSNIQIELFGVDRQKDDPDHFGLVNSIELVPTFIVRSNGAELFRMVEFPNTTFAEDLLNNLEMGQ